MSKRLVLIVEDDRDDEFLTRRVLAKITVPLRIQVARDGQEAGQLLFGAAGEGGAPDLIVLDLKLPKVDGLQLLAQIRSNPRTTNLPVIVLTSSDNPSDIKNCAQLGVVGYLCKPVSLESLTCLLARIPGWLPSA
ncbi:MAG TPA: response regulator [Geobacterales bacterium]|nr:response regulator [Geobacterales bacterium]